MILAWKYNLNPISNSLCIWIWLDNWQLVLPVFDLPMLLHNLSPLKANHGNLQVCFFPSRLATLHVNAFEGVLAKPDSWEQQDSLKGGTWIFVFHIVGTTCSSSTHFQEHVKSTCMFFSSVASMNVTQTRVIF